jgi:hypothetical protein
LREAFHCFLRRGEDRCRVDVQILRELVQWERGGVFGFVGAYGRGCVVREICQFRFLKQESFCGVVACLSGKKDEVVGIYIPL